MVLSQFRVSHSCTIRIAGIPSAKSDWNEMSSMRIKLKLISALRRALAGLSLDELTLRIRAISSAAPGWLMGCHSLFNPCHLPAQSTGKQLWRLSGGHGQGGEHCLDLPAGPSSLIASIRKRSQPAASSQRRQVT